MKNIVLKFVTHRCERTEKIKGMGSNARTKPRLPKDPFFS